MRFHCACGQLVVDSTDYLPYKGKIIRDQQCEILTEALVKSIVAWVAAAAENREAEWLQTEKLARSGASRETIASILTGRAHVGPHIYQCTACGRIFISKTGKDGMVEKYVTFTPEDDDWQGVLAYPEGEKQRRSTE